MVKYRQMLLKLLLLPILALSFSGCVTHAHGRFNSFEDKKEFARQVGIILPGMTKHEVRATFGLVEPKIRFVEGREVWHYNSPKEQDIYFLGDKVEKVIYYPKEGAIAKDRETEI